MEIYCIFLLRRLVCFTVDSLCVCVQLTFVFSTDDFASAVSNGDGRGQRIGPPVPKDILAELDELAELALGLRSCQSPATEPDATGDGRDWSEQAYSRCLVYKQTVSVCVGGGAFVV